MTLGNIYDNFFWKKWLKVKNLKYTLSSLRQLLATTESPSKMMKIAFYFILKAFLVLKIFKIFSWIFGHVKKRLDQEDDVDFKIHDVTTWLTHNLNTHVDQYFKR